MLFEIFSRNNVFKIFRADDVSVDDYTLQKECETAVSESESCNLELEVPSCNPDSVQPVNLKTGLTSSPAGRINLSPS